MELNQHWQKIKKGDERAFEKLYKEFYAPLCYYSSQITHDSPVSEELVQDIFSRIWLEREIISIHTSLKSYLFQSVRNASINELKKRKTLKSAVNRTASEELWKYVMDNADSNDFIIEKITSADTAQTINQAIEVLPAQCRQVFQLSRMENKSNEKIAEQLNISISTVKTHILNALTKISNAIRKEK